MTTAIAAVARNTGGDVNYFNSQDAEARIVLLLQRVVGAQQTVRSGRIVVDQSDFVLPSASLKQNICEL